MGEITIHGMIGSPFVRSVLVALAEKGQGYRLRPLRLDAMRTPDYEALHPFRRVPVFEQDGFVLYETQAILRHIERIWPVPAMVPRDPIAAARMDQTLAVVDNYLFEGAGRILGFNRLIRPRFLKEAPDEEACAKAARRVGHALGVLAGLWAGPARSGDLTLADIALACHLDFLHLTPEGASAIAAEPALDDLRRRLGERESFRDTTIESLARRFLPPKSV